MDELCTGSLGPATFAQQLEDLQRLAGDVAAAGIDAVAIDGLAVLPDAALETVTRWAVEAGVPIVLSWDLLAIPPARLARVARIVGGAA